MKWFKKLFFIRLESQSNKTDKRSAITENILNSSSSVPELNIDESAPKKNGPVEAQSKEQNCGEIARQLGEIIGCVASTSQPHLERQIVDPDDFFSDPEEVAAHHVKQLERDWIIIETNNVDDSTMCVYENGQHTLAIVKNTALVTDCDRRAFSNSLMGPLLEPSEVFQISHRSAKRLVEQKEKLCLQKMFGLNDHGGILIHLDHIEVHTGFVEIAQRRKDYGEIIRGTELTEMYKVRTSFEDFLAKFFLRILRKSGHPQNRTSGSPGELVENYALELARNHASTFSKNIENFIACTKESTETAPQVVMRNMRQFMSGMKNYLVKHGEADFQREVKRASSRLKPDEFLNLDTILEGVMHRLVVLPLKQHLYNLSVDFYTHSGDLRNLIDNIRLASTKTLIDFGIQKNVSTPTAMELRHISLLFHRMQEADLPLEKLDLLLTVVSCVFDTSKVSRNQLSADDFLPLLIYTVANCGFIGAEIEAEYMWGLLHPSLLNGEAGYYLTALCSAVQMLKNFTTAFDIESPESADSSTSDAVAAAAGTAPSCTLRSSVLKVIIPDEYNGSLQKRTLPVRPNTTTKDLCRIIAHKAGITNPQDYGLFKLVNGEETLLQDNEYPQEVAILSRNKSCAFAYKRIDAKIAWPDEFF